MKALSIIGVVWFSLSLIFLCCFLNSNSVAAEGWGILGLVYAIPFSIVCLVKVLKNNTPSNNGFAEELLKLGVLKEKGLINEEEFNKKKAELI